MFANLFASILISFAVGVSSSNYDHTPTCKLENVQPYDNNQGLVSYAQIDNLSGDFYFAISPFSDDFQYCDFDYVIANYDTYFSDSGTPYQIYFELLTDNNYVGYYEFRLNNDNSLDIICEIFGNEWSKVGTYKNGNYTHSEYFFDYDDLTYSRNVRMYSQLSPNKSMVLSTFSRWWIFYTSQYRFNKTVVDLSTLNVTELFSTQLVDNYFGLSTIHGEKLIYKGWFRYNGILYNQIKTTVIDAQSTKYYNGIASSSSDLKTVVNTSNTYIYTMNVYLINTHRDYSVLAYQPQYYHYDNTLSTYIDISVNGWLVNNVEFISIGEIGEGNIVARSDLQEMSYFELISYRSERVAINPNSSYSWLNSTFNLLRLGFVGLSGLFSIQILPFVNLGTLLFLPIAVLIILAIIKLFKR